MSVRQTHTYALVEVSIPTWEEIRDILMTAGYGHIFHEHDDGRPMADMQGLAIIPHKNKTELPYGTVLADVQPEPPLQPPSVSPEGEP